MGKHERDRIRKAITSRWVNRGNMGPDMTMDEALSIFDLCDRYEAALGEIVKYGRYSGVNGYEIATAALNTDSLPEEK